jgi:propane monooxygenase coupling protein
VTTTATSAFGAVNKTSSNRAGMTLMNDQVGEVIAQVMKDKPGVTITYLPSMIRVDGAQRTDYVYDEFAEALGEEPGSFTSADLEESMSTHYGRMVHEDDRTIMFANPEEAAEYLGFDLRPVDRTETGPTAGPPAD